MIGGNTPEEVDGGDQGFHEGIGLAQPTVSPGGDAASQSPEPVVFDGHAQKLQPPITAQSLLERALLETDLLGAAVQAAAKGPAGDAVLLAPGGHGRVAEAALAGQQFSRILRDDAHHRKVVGQVRSRA